MPLTINFVNMPFSNLARPSIALTQLKEVTQRAHGPSVTTQVSYLNHDFGRALGEDIYTFASESATARNTGLGEWFFRRAAFADFPDNRDDFWARFAHHFDAGAQRWFEEVLCPFRERLRPFFDDLIGKYRLNEADIVGFTSMFWQNLASVGMARRLREINPRQLLVIGGANCEGTMGIELAASFPVFDFVFSGPALVSFPEFVGHLLAGNIEACQRIDGVFSTKNSRSILTMGGATDVKPAALLEGVAVIGKELDINTRIELDYDDFFASLEANVSVATGFFKQVEIFFETSRGCWWGERAHCTFCGLNGATMAYRAMQPSLAQELIEGLAQKYASRGGGSLMMMSVDNILPKEYFDTLFTQLKIPEGVALFYEVKADLTDEQIGQLARSGVRYIQPGIESLATATLKLMRKGTTSFGNIRFLMSCARHEVSAYWNILVGSPGETEETYNAYYKNLPLLFHLQPPMGAFQIRFDRFSPYFNTPESYGLKLRPYDLYAIAYPLPEPVLMRLAYYFENANAEAQYFVDCSNALNRLKEIVARWQSRWRHSKPENRPRLELRTRNKGHVVIDSRRGTALTVPVSHAELEVLRDAIKATDKKALIATHGQAVESVLRKGLMFGERGRVMNLVVGVTRESAHERSRLEDIGVEVAV